MSPHTMTLRVAIATLSLLVAACGGYDVEAPAAAPGGGGPGPGPGADPAAFFATRIEPRLEFCRGCHVPDGIADTARGERFMLSLNPAEDYAKVRASWEALDKGVDQNGILLKASNTDPERHSGGAAWPVGSIPYADMRALLSCWDDPATCAAPTGGTEPPQLPLLGSSRGGHYWHDYCAGKPDDTLVPEDPRVRIVEGVNAGKNVYMNAFWQTCQNDDDPDLRRRNHPGTCGELRARVARGYPLVAAAGQVGAGTFFSGNTTNSSYAFPASQYANLWQSVMQLPERPDNFDQLVAERWGMPLSPTPNPYPLDGEDPNATEGGSGQLPMGLTQLRNADGSWTGEINVTCNICHGGGVGTAADGPGLGAMYGTNSLSDITVMFTDLAQGTPQQGALAYVSQNKVRGTGNITNFQLFGTLTLSDSQSNPQLLIDYLSIQAEASTGTEDPPVWWNGGHRTMKFFDAGQVWDSKRIELSFHFPNTPFHSDMEADKAWILDHQQDGDAWITSLKAPVWPGDKLGAVDTTLAEKGAVLFHNKDLWAAELHNPVPAPAERGNGSCASCHGAYAPRYVNDPAFLDDPLFEGIAANIAPLEVIATDSRRLDGNSQRVAEAARSNWFAYADGPYNEAGIPLCADWNDTALRGDRALGYLAPPLYGVWATAPYLHNGAVPDVAGILDPSSRPRIWRRVSKAAREDQAGTVIMGFDERLGAYDTAALGWKFDELACGVGSMPFIDCSPAPETTDATFQDALTQAWLHGGLAWNLLNLPIMDNQQIEDRKVYNTYYYSQSNAGHEFTQVLTAEERRALIEYLKTL